MTIDPHDTEGDANRLLEDASNFLKKHAQRRQNSSDFEWGAGSDRVALFRNQVPEDEARELADLRRWRALIFDAGFGWISGPRELGGRGLPAAVERAYEALERQYAVPSRTLLGVSLGMVTPTIEIHGTTEQKAQWLAKLRRGDLVGCQLFSEPEAGSDLAGVRTTAVKSGDAWIINSQKVWTSGAHYSDLGLLLARTSSEDSRHAGMTMFLIDMRQPGVEVRPLRQMSGGCEFNEVFLADAVVPDANRLDELGRGWDVAMTTLRVERAAIGGPAGGGSGIFRFDRYVALAKARSQATDPAARQQMATLYTGLNLARLTMSRAQAKLKAGDVPGPEMSVSKLALVANLKSASQVVSSILGPALIADTGEWGTYAWTEFICGVPGLRLGGGTDEIQRNTIAERVLGLPR